MGLQPALHLLEFWQLKEFDILEIIVFKEVPKLKISTKKQIKNEGTQAKSKPEQEKHNLALPENANSV